MHEIKQLASAYMKENRIRESTYSALKESAENLGYIVVEFSRSQSSKDVSLIVNSFHLNDYVAKSNGFVFVNDKYKLIFVNEDLNEIEKKIVLAHELGHVVCKHASARQNVTEEHEANEFAHYLLRESFACRVKSFVSKQKTALITSLLVLMLAFSFVSGRAYYNARHTYYKNYYVIDTGHKYHKKDCKYIKNRNDTRRLTISEYESSSYAPCSVCIP